MSTSGPRYHIPFPRNFLSLNTPLKKTTTPPTTSAALPVVDAEAHTFLSNRPSGRTNSMSSDTSSGSIISTPSSPAAQAVTTPVLEQKVAFLPLNSKYAAPPTQAKIMFPGGFLSNRH
ncbi:hypothetical protein M011DRAFT_462720 [Sporormia fimetaria CBS 119925]|uniref:Uncharacterized protein n=1 Tax=Sporormia fimetaria CBS 119925 TaxID=1340428 RepID=A0A6A6UYM9_9PLEO|nr:hypothetical protein M011DRAFT_462720 [Sporormia fimetaria CBS 119925]